MSKHPLLNRLFLLNAMVLITHQIDAAFWHEWEMFLIPGGNQVNLLLNLPIIALVLHAHHRVITRAPSARAFFQLLAGLGFLTVTIHTLFVLGGHPEFLQPMSLALLASTLLLSSWQLLALRRLR